MDTPEERRIRNAIAAQPTVTDTSQATPTQIMSQRNDLQREINQTIKLTVDDNSVVLRDGTIPFEPLIWQLNLMWILQMLVN